MAEKAITVLLVDDHDLVRRGFRRLLEDDPGLQVVGEASDGQAAVETAAAVRPQVVVMDFALPGMNGAAAAKEILRVAPETAVLMLSMHSEPAYVRMSLDAGARGYLLKNAMDLEMVQAVNDVAAGKRVIDPRLGHWDETVAAAAQLTKRELEVLQLIVQGKSNKDIAALLGLSANTIAVHRANIMQAMGIHNTADLVVHAIRQGLVNIT